MSHRLHRQRLAVSLIAVFLLTAGTARAQFPFSD